MKKLLAVILVLVTVFSVCACNAGNNGTSSESAEASSEPEKVYPESLTINGIPLKDFSIIYAPTNDCAKFEDAAKALRDYFSERFGVKLRIYKNDDATHEAAPNEFLFGYCSYRGECSDYAYNMYEFDEYTVEVKGDRVLFVSSNASAAYQAVKAFIERVDNDPSGVYPECKFDGKGKIIKVACVGDSITQGINSADPYTQTYPAYIQKMLGLDYYVLNAGMSGYSTCASDDYAYKKSTAYTKTLKFAPDVMIYNLGTNDANPGQPYKNWEDHDRKSEFIASAHELIDTIVATNPDMQVYMCVPSSLFKVTPDKWSAEAWNKNLTTYSIPTVKEVIADYGYPSIDLYTWSLSHPELFPDGLHPINEGYRDYAEYIYECIKDTVKKPE